MININHLSIALLLCITISSCSNGQSTDPVEFGKKFNNVCKVGINGGDGTLIKNRWVLTAGHVAEGMYQRSKGNLYIYFENKSEYKVKHVFLHPKYEPMGLYDIALLELEKEVSNIVPAKIYTDTNEINQLIFLAGHGDKKQTDGSWIKDGKLRGYTNIIDKVNDTHILFDYDAPENNATENEGTSGPGDSGGPAFIKKGNTYYVAGVSSMGEPGVNGPATYGAIEHFVRVSKFQTWIFETINHPDEKNTFSLQETTTGDKEKYNLFSKTEQSKNAKIIIDALSNFSEEKMIAAITKTYDKEILAKRPASQIMQNMPVLINKLQNSRLKEITSESLPKISMLMTKDNDEYMLEIFFFETTGKIEQMGFAKLN